MKTNWQTKKLGEVLNVLTNGVNCKQNKDGKGCRITRIETIAQAKIDLNRVGYCKLNEFEKIKYKLKKGDILFSHINSVIHVGKTAIFNSEEELYHGINLLLMRPKNFLLSGYLQYFLRSLFLGRYWNKVCKQSVNQASVNQQDIKKIDISFPESLSEQKRIVKILDEAFEKIEKAKENAEKNLKNSKELFESYLQNVFANPGKDWEEKKLKEIGVTQTGLTPKTANKKYYGNFVPFITPADIDISGNGSIRYDSKGLSESGLEVGRKIKKNSVLMVCIGATIGKVGFTTREVSCNQQVNTLTPSNKYDAKLFYYILSTKLFFNKVIKSSSQATLPIINKGKWENLSVSFPKSISEQKAIIKKFEVLSEQTKKLEEVYKKKLADLEELKKSVLNKAFTGEL